MARKASKSSKQRMVNSRNLKIKRSLPKRKVKKIKNV